MFFWTVGLIGNIIYLRAEGRSLVSIFTFGMAGDLLEKSNIPIDFIGMFGFFMPAALLYINEYSKNIILKIILFTVTLILFINRGFRFVIIILLVAPIIAYYLKKRREPKFRVMVIVLTCLLFMISIIRNTRNNIRASNLSEEVSITKYLGIEAIDEALYDNFSMYKPFYIITEKVPNIVGYTYGSKTFVNPILMLVPRAIWKDKKFLYEDIDSKIFKKEVLTAGSAYPNIAEYYLEYGILGVILGMLILGLFTGYSTKWLVNRNKNYKNIVFYSIFIPLTMQIIIRGYMASNFNLILFTYLPAVLIAKSDKCIERKHS